MGRHKRMSAAATREAVTTSDPEVTAGHFAWEPSAHGPDLSGIEPERRERIERFEPKTVSLDMIEQLRPWVLWCATRVPFTSHQTDRRRLGQTYALLAEDMDLHGDVDPARAFRFSNVREHVERRRRGGMAASSRNSVQSNLYAIGRCIAPAHYPPRVAGSERVSVKCAATEQQVRVLEAAAARIRGVTADRLRIILDLTTHAGARSRELTQVRGRDIVEEQIDGRLVLTVRLVNRRSGRERRVPILDPVVAARLAATAKQVGAGGTLLGTPGNMKNAVNKVFATVRQDHGVTAEVTADQLRGFFVTRLAQAPIPVVLVQELADMGNSHSLYEWTKNLEAPALPAQVAMLAGVTR